MRMRTTSPSEHASHRPRRRERIGRVLALLGRGVLAFHPRLVNLTGSVTSALMLSQSLYWTKVLALQGTSTSREGWFWKTRQDWRTETSLSRHEQDNARGRLSKHAFWHEHRVGMPARLWFRLDLGALAHEIDDDFSGTWDWHDEQALMRLLGRPLLVYRALADLTGSVTSALLLSRLIMDERVALRGTTAQESGGWYRYDRPRLLAGTGLTRAEFYHARKTLRAAGFIAERCVGLPPRWEWRLDLEAIAAALEAGMATTEAVRKPPNGPETRAVAQLAGIRTSSMGQNPIQECGKPTFLYAENPHTGNPESGQLDFSIPANMMAGVRTPSRPDSGRPIEGLTTGKPISTPLPPTPSSIRATPGQPGATGGGGAESNAHPDTTHFTGPRRLTDRFIRQSHDDLGNLQRLPAKLIWPSVLLEAEQSEARRLLEPISTHGCEQKLLDELAGQAAQHPIRQPLAYLRRLVEQVKAGTFVAIAAARVEYARQRQARHQLDRVQRGLAPSPSSSPTRVDLTDEQRAARRRDLELMKQRLSRSAVTFPRTQQPEH